jgi:hypothetical protein
LIQNELPDTFLQGGPVDVFSELTSGNFRVLDRGHYKTIRSLKVPGMIVQDGGISRKRW